MEAGSDLLSHRHRKLAQLRQQGDAFPNDFRPNTHAESLQQRYRQASAEQLEQAPYPLHIAGRIMAKRVMGKAGFAVLQDGSGRIQLFFSQQQLNDSDYSAFKQLDIGDLIGIKGPLFLTRSKELSIRVEQLRILSKSLRPLPEKWHRLSDRETRFRQRYLDLIMNDSSRQLFLARSAIIQQLRTLLVEQQFIEVETPMMHPIPGGATARPFVTQHHRLNMSLYLRIAPELYLKRLLVGGFERVFELNRCFRNEGLSTRHNPEFSMLEFYQAYADYRDLMRFIETLIGTLACTQEEKYPLPEGQKLDLRPPFARLSLQQAVLNAYPELAGKSDLQQLTKLCRKLNLATAETSGRMLFTLFEHRVEAQLQQPTFIVDYPTELSPLAKRKPEQTELCERFELFIGGQEIANGFSELNDPEDQRRRFQEQMCRHHAGDNEAMRLDEDYLQAMEYGMPPCAGAGIGVDRLVMLLTASDSIRDVLLFPQLRPKERAQESLPQRQQQPKQPSTKA